MGAAISAIHVLRHPRSAALKEYAWIIKRLSFIQILFTGLDILLFFLRGDQWPYLASGGMAFILGLAGFLTAFTLHPLTGILYLLVLLMRVAFFVGLTVYEALDTDLEVYVYVIQGAIIGFTLFYLIVAIFYVIRLYDKDAHKEEPDRGGYSIVETEYGEA